jgi:hypothetical protein
MITTELLRVEVTFHPKGSTISGTQVSDFVVSPGQAKRHMMWTVSPEKAVAYTTNGIFFIEETFSVWLTPIGEAADGVFTGDLDFTLTHGGVENIMGMHKQTFVDKALEMMCDEKSVSWDIAFLLLINLDTGEMKTRIVSNLTIDNIIKCIKSRSGQ